MPTVLYCSCPVGLGLGPYGDPIKTDEPKPILLVCMPGLVDLASLARGYHPREDAHEVVMLSPQTSHKAAEGMNVPHGVDATTQRLPG